MNVPRIYLVFTFLLVLSACTRSPVITSFSASDDAVSPGEAVTLSWSASNYDSLTLNPAVGSVADLSSVTVTPDETTTYVLTADRGGSSVSKELEVEVGQEPTVETFQVSPNPVRQGETATLTWKARNVASVTINGESQEAEGSMTVSVTEGTSQDFRLEARNDFGEDIETVTLDIDDTVFFISEFEADPAVITLGDETTLSWAVENAEGPVSFSIDNGVGDVTGESVKIKPDESKTYTFTLTAQDDVSTVTSQVDVRVDEVPSAPTIVNFSADPDNFPEANPQDVTLSWTVEGSGDISVNIDNGVGSFSGSGETTVNPTETTTYTLSASSEFGDDQESVTVTVTPSSPGGVITLLIAGQSNAVGQGDLNSIEPGVSVSGIPQVRMLGNDYRWRQAEEPVDDNEDQLDMVSFDPSPGHSFGVSLGKSLYEDTGQDVYLIPSAMGGSCLTTCTFGGWQPSGPTNRSTLFGSANFRAQVSAGDEPNPRAGEGSEGGPVTALIWYQGESERTNTTNFISNTNVVMNAFMSELNQTGDGLTGVPVLYMQLAQRLESPSRNQGYQEIRERQRLMETEFGAEGSRRDNYYMVVTHDLPMGEPNHLSALGQKILGERIALAYREHVLGLSVDGTGPRLVNLTRDTTTIRLKTNQTINNSSTYENYVTVIVNDTDNRTAIDNEITLRRDPGDSTAVLITLADAITSEDKVVVQYMPPSTASPSYPTDQLTEVIKNPSTGLPLPAFTQAVP